jgi:hypothetical protein
MTAILRNGAPIFNRRLSLKEMKQFTIGLFTFLYIFIGFTTYGLMYNNLTKCTYTYYPDGSIASSYCKRSTSPKTIAFAAGLVWPATVLVFIGSYAIMPFDGLGDIFIKLTK